MKSRYSRTQSKDRIKDFSKDHIKDLNTTDQGINIQIFNITGRHRNVFNILLRNFQKQRETTRVILNST